MCSNPRLGACSMGESRCTCTLDRWTPSSDSIAFLFGSWCTLRYRCRTGLSPRSGVGPPSGASVEPRLPAALPGHGTPSGSAGSSTHCLARPRPLGPEGDHHTLTALLGCSCRVRCFLSPTPAARSSERRTPGVARGACPGEWWGR